MFSSQCKNLSWHSHRRSIPVNLQTIYEPSIEFFLSFVLMDRGQNTLWHGNIQTVTWTSRSHANVDIIFSVQSTFSYKIFYSKCNYSIAARENKSKVQIPTTDPQNDTFCTGDPCSVEISTWSCKYDVKSSTLFECSALWEKKILFNKNVCFFSNVLRFYQFSILFTTIYYFNN